MAGTDGRHIGRGNPGLNQIIARRRKLRLAAVVGVVVTALPQLASADANWVGGASSDWNNAANWSTSPGGQTLIINNTGGPGVFPVISGDPTFTPVDLRIGTGATGRVDQTAGTAGTGNGNWMFLGYSGGTATYNLANTATSGGTFTGFGQGSGNFSAGEIFIGLDNGTNSTINVNTSGTLTTAYMALGSAGGATGNLNIDNGTVNISGELQVGGNMFNQGSGTDTLSMSGGTLTANIISFSRGNNNANVMTGIGNITGGTLTANAYLTLGFAGGASALASVTNNGGTINVGKTGTAAMEMTVFDSVSAQYTQGSGALNIDNNSTIAFGNGGNNNSTSTFTQNGGNVTFYSDAGTTVGGTGSLILGVGGSTGTYTYNLNGGTLTVPLVQKTAAGSSGTFNFNGGTLKATGNNANFMTGLTAANVNSGGAIIDTQNFNITVGQALLDGGGGGLTKNGAGMLTLTGISTFTGGTTVSGGTLALATGGSAGAIRGNLTINSGTTVNLTATDALGYGTGTAVTQINVNGGTLNNSVNANNSYLASWTLTGGNITSTGGGTFHINAGGGATIASNASANTSLISANVAIRGANSILPISVADGAAATDLLISGALTNSPYEAGNNGIAKTGDGMLVLTAASTYSGPTAISAGTLQLGDGTTDGMIASTSGVTIAGGATFALNRASNISSSYPITGAGSLVKSGAGTQIFTGSSLYTGDTAISAGTLAFTTSQSSIGNVIVANSAGLGIKEIGNATTTLASAGAVTFGSSSLALDFGGLTNPTVALGNFSSGTLTLNGNVSISLAGVGGLTTTLNSTSLPLLTYSSQTGSGTFTLATASAGHTAFSLNDTANTLYLSVSALTNVWTGATNGTWDINTTSNWSASDQKYLDGDIVLLDDTGNNTAINLAATVNPSSVTFNNSAKTYTISGGGSIAGSATVIKNGSGLVALGTSNSYMGGTTINAGTIAINSSASLGDSSGDLTVNAGTLETTGNITTTRNITLGNASSTILTDSGTSYTVNGLVSGAGTLNKSGAGTLVLGSNNVYGGGTTISSGTLQITTTSGSANSGVFNLNGGNFQVNVGASNFNYAPTINVNGSSTFSSIGAGQINYVGTITGSGSPVLTIATGSSRLYMNGTMSGISQFNVTSGAVGFDVNSGNNRGTASVNVANGAALWYFGNNFNPISNNITFNGGDGQNNVGALYYEGGVPVSAPLTGNITLASGTTGVGSQYGDTITLGGTVSGPGGLKVINGFNGTTLVLTAADSFTGDVTTLGSSNLIVSGVGQLGSGSYAGNISMTGGTLIFNTSANQLLSGGITGSSAVVQSGSGVLTLTGANVYTGLTSVQGGTLAVTGGTVGVTSANIEIAPVNGTAATMTVSGNAVVNAQRVIIAGNEANNAGGPGTLIQTGGTINASQWFTVGAWGGGNYTVTNGTLNVLNPQGFTQLEVGTFGGAAGDSVMTVNSGSAVNLDNNANLILGAQGTSQNATVTQNSGNITFYSDTPGTSIGGTGAVVLGSAANPTGVYTYNLNGGLLTTPQVTTHINSGGGTSVFNFNGGTLQAAGNSSTFFQGLTQAVVQAGGAKIDSNSFNVTVAQALLHDSTLGATLDGGLTKLGVGTLTLTAASTYTGGTVISAGTLQATGTALGDGTVTLAGGDIAVNDGVTPTAQTLTTGSNIWNGNSSYTARIFADGTSDNIVMSAGNSTLDVSSLTTGSPFTVHATAAAGSLDPNAGYDWTIGNFTALTGVTLPTAGNPTVVAQAGVNGTSFILDLPTSLFSGNAYGSGGAPLLEFEALGGGYSLDVVYDATPEPTTALLVVADGLPMLMARRRRTTTVVSP